MAGAGAYLWESGDVVTAANLQQFVQDQIIAVFNNAAARDAAYGGAGEPVLAEGMFCYLKDTDQTLYYNSAAWEPLGAANDSDQIVLAASLFS